MKTHYNSNGLLAGSTPLITSLPQPAQVKSCVQPEGVLALMQSRKNLLLYVYPLDPKAMHRRETKQDLQIKVVNQSRQRAKSHHPPDGVVPCVLGKLMAPFWNTTATASQVHHVVPRRSSWSLTSSIGHPCTFSRTKSHSFPSRILLFLQISGRTHARY